jgi:hypothetical protein
MVNKINLNFGEGCVHVKYSENENVIFLPRSFFLLDLLNCGQVAAL